MLAIPPASPGRLIPGACLQCWRPPIWQSKGCGSRIPAERLGGSPEVAIYEPGLIGRAVSTIKTLHAKYSADNKKSAKSNSISSDPSLANDSIRRPDRPIVEALERGLCDRGRTGRSDASADDRFLVNLFHGPSNPAGAQLIFATHDVNLLSNRYFRRDQICSPRRTAARQPTFTR